MRGARADDDLRLARLPLPPVTISAPALEDQAFKQKALEATGNAKLIPIEELESLNAKNNQFAGRSGRFLYGGGDHSAKRGKGPFIPLSFPPSR
jgi:hypothetical protein